MCPMWECKIGYRSQQERVITMNSIVGEVLNNYSPETSETSVFFRQIYPVAHGFVGALIFLGYLTPLQNDWSYTYGPVKFRMTRKKYRELKALTNAA